MEGSTGHGQAPRKELLLADFVVHAWCTKFKNVHQRCSTKEDAPRQKCFIFKGSRILPEVAKWNFSLWQCGGHGFESRMLHSKKSVNTVLSRDQDLNQEVLFSLLVHIWCTLVIRSSSAEAAARSTSVSWCA